MDKRKMKVNKLMEAKGWTHKPVETFKTSDNWIFNSDMVCIGLCDAFEMGRILSRQQEDQSA